MNGQSPDRSPSTRNVELSVGQLHRQRSARVKGISKDSALHGDIAFSFLQSDDAPVKVEQWLVQHLPFAFEGGGQIFVYLIFSVLKLIRPVIRSEEHTSELQSLRHL